MAAKKKTRTSTKQYRPRQRKAETAPLVGSLAGTGVGYLYARDSEKKAINYLRKYIGYTGRQAKSARVAKHIAASRGVSNKFFKKAMFESALSGDNAKVAQKLFKKYNAKTIRRALVGTPLLAGAGALGGLYYQDYRNTPKRRKR